MAKFLIFPALLLLLSYAGVHHFLVGKIEFKQGRQISSEKPISFSEINTFKAVTHNAPIPGPLFFAINSNQLDKVKDLIEKGHNIYALNDKRQNALMVSVELGHKEVFEYLMTLNFDLDHQDIYGMTDLMYAAEKNHFQMLRPMLKKDHDITILSAREKSTFDYAKETKSVASLKLLLKVEAPCNTSCEL